MMPTDVDFVEKLPFWGAGGNLMDKRGTCVKMRNFSVHDLTSKSNTFCIVIVFLLFFLVNMSTEDGLRCFFM